jgi:ABC-type nitrate/sulfonate/bicarbonate transport system permease component
MLVAVLLLLWEASARLGWILSDNWPPISQIARALVLSLASGELLGAMWSTLYRMSLGFMIGALVAITLGVILARSVLADRLLRPPIEVLRTLPGPAILPPLILLLGVEDTLKVTVIAMASFFPVFVNAYAGVKGIDSTLLMTAKTFRLAKAVTLRRFILPATLPAITAGMRVSLSIALTVAVIAEMISGASGMGYLLMSMQYAMRADVMYAAVALLAATGYLLNRLFLALEGRLLFWRAH